MTRVTFWQSQKRGPQLKTAHEAAGHGIKSPEWKYNMSVRPSDRPRAFLQFLYLYSFPIWESSVMMHLSPHWYPLDPSGLQFRLCVCLSVKMFICILSLYLSVRSSASIFWQSKRVARTCVQHMQPQTTGTNPSSGSITCLSIHLYVHLREFCNFCICIQ